ncbi:TIGR04076 family protein [Aerococcaceae bacterium DSM 111022]|nr:TIGR04076 family protein [Aerococcaceae bacterium DSM 111022]
MDDSFTLYNLKVEVVETGRPFVCSHKTGDYFLVEGENLIFPENNYFSMYSLSALLPLLPAKQRPLHENDWMLSDAVIACPDPHCGAAFKITRTNQRLFSHAETTVVPLAKDLKESNND